MNFRSFALTDKGKVRKSNQDSYLINETEKLFIIADGLGGRASGDVASQMAVKDFEELVIKLRKKQTRWPIKKKDNLSLEQNRLLAAAVVCNNNIITQGYKKPHLKGMGTALLGMSIENKNLAVVNIGDCRLYRIRDNTIEQITKDQTQAAAEIKKGNTVEDANSHPKKHILTSAVGHMASSSKIAVLKKSIKKKDIFLMCTDGLYNMISDKIMLDIIMENRNKSLYQMGISLVLKANLSGGTDNITVLLLSFD